MTRTTRTKRTEGVSDLESHNHRHHVHRHHLSSPICIICSNSWPASRDHLPDIPNAACEVPYVLSQVVSEDCDHDWGACA